MLNFLHFMYVKNKILTLPPPPFPVQFKFLAAIGPRRPCPNTIPAPAPTGCKPRTPELVTKIPERRTKTAESPSAIPELSTRIVEITSTTREVNTKIAEVPTTAEIPEVNTKIVEIISMTRGVSTRRAETTSAEMPEVNTKRAERGTKITEVVVVVIRVARVVSHRVCMQIQRTRCLW